MNQLAIRSEGGILKPDSMDGLNMLVHALHHAAMLPKGHTPATAIGAALCGMSAGLNAIQAIQSVAMINGRATIWGDAALALASRSGLLEDITEVQEKDGKGGWIATCTVKRAGRMPHTMTYSTDEAKASGVTGKGGPWVTYPRRMCQMRARSFALRDVFPDVLMGLHVSDARDAEDAAAHESQDAAPQSALDRFNSAAVINAPQQPEIPMVTPQATEEPTPPPMAKTADDVKRMGWLNAWDKAMSAPKWDDEQFVADMGKRAAVLDRIDRTTEWTQKVADMLEAYKAQNVDGESQEPTISDDDIVF